MIALCAADTTAVDLRQEIEFLKAEHEASVVSLKEALRETDALLDEWYELAHLSGGGRGGTLVARTRSRLEKNDRAALASSEEGDE
jgi:hypothetical protein